MSKFLTAPQWYDAGGGLNKSLDVNCNNSVTATAFGNGANARFSGVAIGNESSADDGIAVGKGAESNKAYSVAIGYMAKNNGFSNEIAIGWNAENNPGSGQPHRRIQFLKRDTSPITTETIGFGSRSLLDLIYPVDSIYISVSSENPGTIFGGTWEAFATGKTLVGVDANDTDFNAAENAGGSKKVTLDTTQIPAHKHSYVVQNRGQSASGLMVPTEQGSCKTNVAAGGDLYALQPTFGGSEMDTNGYFNILETGGNQPHNNMPPYITVYMWKRTA